MTSIEPNQDDSNKTAEAMHLAKRRKGNHEQNSGEQVISESSLTKLVGAADVYNLEVKWK